MRKHGKTRNIRSALNSTFIFAVVLPIFVLLVIFSIYISEDVKKTNIVSSVNTLSIMSNALDSELDSINEFSIAYENNSKFRNFFYYYYLYGDRTEEEYLLSYKDRLYEYAQAINSYLKLASLNNVVGIGFIPNNNETGGMLYHEIGSSYSPIVSYNGRNSRWYNELVSNPYTTTITYEYASYLEEPDYVLSLTNTVWNNSGSAPIGFIKIDISKNFYEGILNSLTIDPRSRIEISFDSCGFHYASPSDFTGKVHTESIHSEKHGYTIRYHIPLWSLYSGFPIKFGMALTCFALALFGAGIAFRRFSNRIVNDYKPITTTLNAYRGGSRPEKMDVDQFTITEIQEMAATLDNMIDEVEYHIEKEYKNEIEQKRAEFRALQAEINPHFLYNTLNNLLALNRIGDKKLLEQSIVSLSRLFRYTCERNETGLSTVGEEFEFLENYLKLQKLRYDDRLDYRMNMDPDTEKSSIPKLLLQPLVENAIVHGLEPCDHPVTIYITSTHFYTKGIGEIYLLSVINDGCPFNVEESSRHSRVGLTNIENRLHTFWPDSVMITKGGEGKLTEFHIVMKHSEGGIA